MSSLHELHLQPYHFLSLFLFSLFFLVSILPTKCWIKSTILHWIIPFYAVECRNHERDAESTYLAHLKADKSYNRHKWLMHICKHVHRAITSKRHYVKCTNFKLDWFVGAYVIHNSTKSIAIFIQSRQLHTDICVQLPRPWWKALMLTHMCHDLAHCWMLLLIILWNFGQLNGN